MKTAVITGAAGGIGFACVEKFAREGYEIVAMDLAAEETALAKFAPLGDKIHYFRGKHVVVINKGATARDVGANLTIDGAIGEVLAQI